MSDYRLYWGDIHNHNELGYAQGSLERSYDIARSHLDFYAFTPHGQHADGRIEQLVPCFTSDPFDEERRKVANLLGETACSWKSHTSRGGVFTTRNGSTANSANGAICLEIVGNERTRLTLRVRWHLGGRPPRRARVALRLDGYLRPRRRRGERFILLSEGNSGERADGLEQPDLGE